jgi:hypothetical protein
VRSEGGAPLPADAVSRLTLQTANFAGSATIWQDVAAAWTQSGIEWVTTLPVPSTSRVYRAIEKGGNP